MTEIILHPENNVRIFRPHEVTALIRNIPKKVNIERFEALLYTGSRFSEMREVHGKMGRIDGNFIRLMNTKALVKEKFRYVRLNNPGLRAVEYYMRHSKPLPTHQTWDENLKKWCKYAGLDATGVCAKSTRKTWESWLVTMYPKYITQIYLSIGHSSDTALKHYLQLPFTTTDVANMNFYTEGWIQSQ
ncbi:hypothetical protein A3K72_00640 [Candidatus Woesearchaeota archaeon RBG_13_36_6]|nr:MAG: hypothetical protein A3K72_00640 [Candidatus Woesearchaeota archaeon RBG_13_36_6]